MPSGRPASVAEYHRPYMTRPSVVSSSGWESPLRAHTCPVKWAVGPIASEPELTPLSCPTMAGDAKTMLETAVRGFLSEVPALEPMKVVVAVDLHGRGDTQQFRIEMPGVKVTKGMAN